MQELFNHTCVTLTFVLFNDGNERLQPKYVSNFVIFVILQTVELIHNGKDTKVTNENKMQYLDLLAQHRLSNCVQEEIEAFLKGKEGKFPSRWCLV